MVDIVCASITDDEVLIQADAVVNSTNPQMKNGAGVSNAIFKKAGIVELENYCANNFSAPMKVSELRITPGFGIPCEIILHKLQYYTPIYYLIRRNLIYF